jgi:hypothetical protein
MGGPRQDPIGINSLKFQKIVSSMIQCAFDGGNALMLLLCYYLHVVMA